METKHLLFIQHDPFLGSFYRDKLEGAGFSVETARDASSGRQRLGDGRVDLVVLDSLLPNEEAAESIRAIRSQDRAVPIPIVMLPTIHHAVAQAALDAGAMRVLDRASNPMVELLDVASGALGLGKVSASAREGAAMLDPHWEQATLSAAPGSLVVVRDNLHAVMREPSDHVAFRALLQSVHGFAGQVSLLGENALSHVAAALEVLVFGLDQCPERIDSLVLRTLGQAVDFLSLLLDKGAHAHSIDLGGAQTLVIEDEANARELIIAAMGLVGLNADGLDAPGASLAVLSAQPCDLIFLDVNLPEMNGFELCTKIRALPWHEKTPIVFLTGMTSFQNRVQSSLSGGNDFVGKPFNMAELGVKALIWVLKGQLNLH